jgi:pteridine reductase
MNLAGRHVFITGAAKRVARCLAETLLSLPAADGLKLTAHYHNSRGEALELAALGKAKGREVLPLAADLRNVKSLPAVVDQAVKRFGPVDILVNSASDFFPTPALTCTEEEWDRLLGLNLKSQFFLTQSIARTMREGVILNVADVNGERPMRNFTPYTCSKAGLLMMTRNLAKEWAPRIRVNSISPGAVLLPENYTDEQRQRSIERSLLKRLGSPEDIAHGALFLIANDYITGFDLKVDGGRSLA